MTNWWKTAGQVALGTGVAEQDFNAFTVPEPAKVIWGIRVNQTPVTVTADESVLAVGSLTSNDISLNPCEFIYPPSAVQDGTLGMPGAAPYVYYPLNIVEGMSGNIVGGSTITAHATALVSNTAAPYAFLDFLLGDDPADLPPSVYDPYPMFRRYHKVGTLGASTANGTTTLANNIQITGAELILGLFAALTRDTAAAAAPACGYFTYRSQAFPLNDIELHGEIHPAQLGTTTSGAQMHLTHEWMKMPTAATANVNVLYTQGGAVNNTNEDFVAGLSFKRVGA